MSAQTQSLSAGAPPPRLLLILLGLWALAATIVGLSGVSARPEQVGLAIGAPLVAWTALYALVPAVRREVDGLSTRTLILIHTFRLFGAAFLIYSGRGLIEAWAVPAAWGDIAVAVTAPLVAWLALTPRRRGWALAWTGVAALDIAAAPLSGLLLSQLIPGSMDAIGLMPLFIIPAVFVPTMILTNVLIARRLLARPA